MGFEEKWVKLMMKCLNAVSFSVMLNGKPGPSFSPTRGLRQGDPISPYSFILVGEVLTAMINDACLSRKLTGIRMGSEGPRISHLLFVDDSLFSLKASTDNCQAMMSILNAYRLASGQTVDFSKSSLFFSVNTPLDIQMGISNVLGIPGSNDPRKYLGLPNSMGQVQEAGISICETTRVEAITFDRTSNSNFRNLGA